MAESQLQMRKLWEPEDPKATVAYQFMQDANKKRDRNMQTWQDLHTWSVDHRSEFWEEIFQQYPLVHSGKYSRVVDETARMDSIPTWFEGVKVNFAENILCWADSKDPAKATTHRKRDEAIACTEVREGCTEIRDVTWREVRERTAILANAMRARGVKRGDRIAVVASNSLDTLVVFYATTAVGGIFSSSSTDMGTKGILDRLRQVTPKYIFMDDWAIYNGRSIDLRPKMCEIEEGLRGVKDVQGLVSMPRWQDKPVDISTVPKCERLSTFLSAGKGDNTPRFERIDFRDPFIIVYSSGTTGMPKCIVHSTGGVLINSKKEGNLHRDALANDPEESCTLQYTTTGWIMYLTSCLTMLHGARAILYDGSPFQPDLKAFIKLVGDQKVTDLGISPRYMQTLATANPPVMPRDVTDLSKLKRVTSTGMVLSEAQFNWFYDHAFPSHVQLGNISGGTDLAACFTMDTTMKPLYCGGTMTPALGMKVEVYDQTIEGGKGVKGKPVPLGESGELVCTRAFPTMPIKFWDDPNGEKYFNAYYARFDDVWTHGDFISIHPQNGQVYLHGRADGVLNPSGVRFGSAEVYNSLDASFPDDIQDSVCVGQRRAQDMDESVMLFLLMKPGRKFTPELVKKVKDAIARDVGRRCVPKYVFETPEIPTTINLKKVELPVKQIVSGKKIKASDTLANKKCLDFYYQFAEVEKLMQPKSKLITPPSNAKAHQINSVGTRHVAVYLAVCHRSASPLDHHLLRIPTADSTRPFPDNDHLSPPFEDDPLRYRKHGRRRHRVKDYYMNGGQQWRQACWSGRNSFRPGLDPMTGLESAQNPSHDYDVVMGQDVLVDGQHWMLLGVDGQPATVEQEEPMWRSRRSERRQFRRQ